MFTIPFKKDVEPSDIEEAIADAVRELRNLDLADEKYAAAVANLKILMEVYAIDEEVDKRFKPTGDQIVAVAGSLAAVLMIMSFEKTHVIATKALTFIPKFKI